jgi:protein ImuB
MSRFVSIYLPHLPLERLQQEKAASGEALAADRPFALVASEERGLLLTAVNTAALNAGLCVGLGLADARAICPHLLTAPASPKKDAETLRDLADWASCRYSPTLNVDGGDGLWLDVTGVPHLFGGERKLLADLSRRLEQAGFTVRLALAGTHGGAHALARYAATSPLIVIEGEIEAALAALPVEALRLEPEITFLLRRLGLKRVGQLYNLPRPSLERRFHSRDTAEAVLLRLDQALGRRSEPQAPLLPAPDFMARLPFPEPLVTHDGVLAGLDHLARALCAKLARAGRGCRRLALWVARADGSSTVIEAGLSAPSREPAHLLRLLRDKVEQIDMGFGVDLMSLAALITETLAPAQIALTERDGKGSAETLVDRLVNRLGASAVRRLVPQASHIPELAQSLRSAFAGPSLWPAQPAKPQRPPLLFANPEPMKVIAEVPEGPPARFTWRRTTRRVVKTEGPERIAPEWWRLRGSGPQTLSSPGLTRRSSNHWLLDDEGKELLDGRLRGHDNKRRIGPHTRDYYRIEDEDGHRYWVFREGLFGEREVGTPAWYLHGVFG